MQPMMEMFNLILEKKLSPNQFYLLYAIREGISPLNINLHQEVRVLESENWLEKVVEGTPWKLTPKTLTLIQQVEGYFKVQKKKTNNQLLGQDYSEKIKEYLEIFPKIKLPSKKPARQAPRNIEIAMRWFFENHDYTWEEILTATRNYVSEYRDKSYLYMQTSQFFIRKQISGEKAFNSALADYCAALEDGGFEGENMEYEEKVV